MKRTLVLIAALSGLSAQAITITDLQFDGDWRNGITATWVGSELDQSTFDLPGNPFAQAQASQDDPIGLAGIAVGISFDESTGPFIAEGLLAWVRETGEIVQNIGIAPAGWVGTSVFSYDPETGDGSVAWSYTNVPDAPWSASLLAIGVACIAGASRRWKI